MILQLCKFTMSRRIYKYWRGSDHKFSRPAAVTTGELEKYKRIIEEARSDLREQLANINERLRSLLQRGASRDRDTADLKDTREEKRKRRAMSPHMYAGL